MAALEAAAVPMVQVARGGRSGFHSPVVDDRDDVLQLMQARFGEGAPISNGWRSVWSRIPAADIAQAHRALLACAGT
ncbi:MAG: hypothetical protein OXD40_05680 [bacterium]|nr:hypothetical protein [bacterium]